MKLGFSFISPRLRVLGEKQNRETPRGAPWWPRVLSLTQHILVEGRRRGRRPGNRLHYHRECAGRLTFNMILLAVTILKRRHFTLKLPFNLPIFLLLFQLHQPPENNGASRKKDRKNSRKKTIFRTKSHHCIESKERVFETILPARRSHIHSHVIAVWRSREARKSQKLQISQVVIFSKEYLLHGTLVY